MKTRFTRRAFSDLSAILSYVNERNPSAARSIRLSLEKTVSVITQFPMSGKLADIADVRVLRIGKYPYLLYYSIQHNEISVIHIRDARQDIWDGS
jgi:addiction module RelE/StbE family toxin